MLEIPAGKLEQYEVREEAAKRELEEETGYVANNLKFITDMYGCPDSLMKTHYILQQ